MPPLIRKYESVYTGDQGYSSALPLIRKYNYAPVGDYNNEAPATGSSENGNAAAKPSAEEGEELRVILNRATRDTDKDNSMGTNGMEKDSQHPPLRWKPQTSNWIRRRRREIGRTHSADTLPHFISRYVLGKEYDPNSPVNKSVANVDAHFRRVGGLLEMKLLANGSRPGSDRTGKQQREELRYQGYRIYPARRPLPDRSRRPQTIKELIRDRLHVKYGSSFEIPRRVGRQRGSKRNVTASSMHWTKDFLEANSPREPEDFHRGLDEVLDASNKVRRSLRQRKFRGQPKLRIRFHNNT